MTFWSAKSTDKTAAEDSYREWVGSTFLQGGTPSTYLLFGPKLQFWMVGFSPGRNTGITLIGAMGSRANGPRKVGLMGSWRDGRSDFLGVGLTCAPPQLAQHCVKTPDMRDAFCASLLS